MKRGPETAKNSGEAGQAGATPGVGLHCVRRLRWLRLEKLDSSSPTAPQNDKGLASVFAGRRLRWAATQVAGLRAAEAEARQSDD